MRRRVWCWGWLVGICWGSSHRPLVSRCFAYAWPNVIGSPLLAADQFGELCKGDVWLRLTFGIIDRISQAEIDRVVDSAVDMFLARYAA